MHYVSNAFSLNMVTDLPSVFHVHPVSLAEATEFALGALSVVGHNDTAAVFSRQLGIVVVPNRTTVSLKKGDVLLVGQYRGPRLPEGATTLPDGATIDWVAIGIGSGIEPISGCWQCGMNVLVGCHCPACSSLPK